MSDDQMFSAIKDGKEEKFYVNSPTGADLKEARKVYNEAFRESIESKAIMRIKLNDFMEEQGLWDKSKELKWRDLRDKIKGLERVLAKGGITKSEGRKNAIELINTRNLLNDHVGTRMQLDSSTAEGQSDNEMFNFLVFRCTVYNIDRNKRVFNDLNDYLIHSNQEFAIKAADILGNLMYGLDPSFVKNLPENKFLKRFGYVNEDLQLIDVKGRLIDDEGRLVDKTGRFINEQGEFVNINGELVDEGGNLIIESLPFLDDDTGKPIIFDSIEAEVASGV